MKNRFPPAVVNMFVGAVLSLTLTAAVFNDPFPVLMTVAVLMFAGCLFIADGLVDVVMRLAWLVWQRVRRD
jgi:hypothetical protein